MRVNKTFISEQMFNVQGFFLLKVAFRNGIPSLEMAQLSCRDKEALLANGGAVSTYTLQLQFIKTMYVIDLGIQKGANVVQWLREFNKDQGAQGSNRHAIIIHSLSASLALYL